MNMREDIERLQGCFEALDKPIFASHEIEEDLLLQLQEIYAALGDGPLYNAFQELFTYAQDDVTKMRNACQRIRARMELAMTDLRKL